MAILKGSVQSVTSEESLRIQEQLKKCICRIKANETQATGFFCLIPYNNKYMPALVSAAYVIYLKDTLTKISIKLNDSIKEIQINDGRKTFTDSDITIIEIFPEKDLVFDFLEIETQALISDSREEYNEQSLYILHHNNNNKIISYGLLLRNIDSNELSHKCNTGNFSGGAPILDLTSGKVLGIHLGSKHHYNFNFGTFIKPPITKFIELYKEYISTNGLTSEKYSLSNCIYTLKNDHMTLFNNFFQSNNNDENEIQQEKETIKELEEKIKELNTLLEDKKPEVNALLSKNRILIEELKSKLSRFPFELLEGEKLMSIIVTSPDKKIIRSIICKNTDTFHDLKKKRYQYKDNIFEIGNKFSINGRKIDEAKSLEFNKIKDNDIIILNNTNI